MAHTDHAHAAPDPELHHEVTDIPLTGTTRVAILSLVIIGIIMAAMYGLWAFFASQARQADTPPPPMADSAYGTRVPAVPRLQSKPSGDLAGYRRTQQEKLTSYAWVDKNAGIARIPVDRAIELLAERASTIADPQLATTPAAPQPSAQPAASPAAPPAPKPAEKPAAH
jgi:hypothetical protein